MVLAAGSDIDVQHLPRDIARAGEVAEGRGDAGAPVRSEPP